jgi:hypothetical protein
MSGQRIPGINGIYRSSTLGVSIALPEIMILVNAQSAHGLHQKNEFVKK